jgi:hypothetical protein
MRDVNGKMVKLHGESLLRLPVSLDERRPLPPVRVASGNKGRFRPVIFADYSRTAPGGGTWGDESAGCRGRLEWEGGKAAFSFSAGPGWGCGTDLLPSSGAVVDALGARRLVLRMSAPAGLRFVVSIAEDGAGPPGSGTFASASGADGEQYISPDLSGNGRMGEVRIDLGQMRRGTQYGNQSGNETVDTVGIKLVGIHVAGGQGSGKILVERITLE